MQTVRGVETGPTLVSLSPPSQARLRDARSVALAAPLVWGGVFGYVAHGLHPGFGTTIFVLSGALLVAVVGLWNHVKARARWLLTFGAVSIAYIQLTFLLGGLAAVAGYNSFALAVIVGVACVLVGGWKLRHEVALYDSEWDQHRAANERDVLDLGVGTYDPARGFAALTGGRRAVVVAGSRSAADLAARFTPVVAGAATIGAVLAGHSRLDVRVAGIAVLSPIASLALTPVLAQALVHLRRLRGYERRLGRPILNR